MQKRTIMTLCGTLAALLFYSCSLPDNILPKKIHITGSPKFDDMPIVTGAVDLNKVIDDNFRKDLPEELGLYDAVNYPGSGAEIQAYLLRYKMISQKLNPNDYLKQYDDAMDNIQNLKVPLKPIVGEFEVPAFPSSGGGETRDIELGLEELFKKAEDVATFSADATIPITPVNGNPPPINDSRLNIALAGFDTLTFKNASLKVTISVPSDGGNTFPSGLTIDILPVLQLGTPLQAYSHILLNENKLTDTTYFDLEGKTITNTVNLAFELDMTYGGIIGPQFDINIKIGWDDDTGNKLQVKAATGLQIGKIDMPLPDDIPPINFGNLSSTGFLHAKIKTGEIAFGIPNMPSKSNTSLTLNPVTDTWFDKFDLIYDIYLQQESLSFAGHGIDGEAAFSYPGLNGAGTSHNISLTDANGTGSEKTHSLNDSHINSNTINLLTNKKSKITIQQADPNVGLDFNFSDEVFNAGCIILKVAQKVVIGEIAEAHVNLGTQINLPEIAPIKIDSAEKYLRWIKFSGDTTNDPRDNSIGLEFVIEELDDPIKRRLDDKLEMTLTLNDFKYYDVATNTDTEDSLVITKTLAEGSNLFINDRAVKLDIAKIAAADVPNHEVKLKFDIDLKAKKDTPNQSGGKVLRIENIAPGDKLTIKTPGWATPNATSDDIVLPFFNWTRALVSLGTAGDIDDQYPKKTDDPPKLDLRSKVGDYMKGSFVLQGAQAGLYISGPVDLINKIEPNLSFAAKYNYDENDSEYKTVESLLPDDYKLNVLAAPITLPPPGADGKYIYTDTILPAGGINVDSGTINKLMADLPSDLIFAYKTSMNEIEVTPDLFDPRPTEGDLVVEVMMLIPMQFKAGDGGAALDFAKMFDEEKDLFGREKPDEFSKFLKVGSAYVNLGFNNALFSNATLKIDKNDRVFPNGIYLGGNSFNIPLGKSDLEAFRNNLLIPHIRLEFPKGATIQIPRDIGLAQISFGVSDLDFEFDLSDLSGQ